MAFDVRCKLAIGDAPFRGEQVNGESSRAFSCGKRVGVLSATRGVLVPAVVIPGF